ncbi:Inner membrane protein YhaI [Caballeronia hypogeia]|uniref:Inner membrane protein YhaI n=1 Tax=Caballeronia hypogeia TaxID=1777140 RepID=A0A157ZSA2_9BURK|nr:DUF805 domain-containing protein [Caballeronia hypogeia]SAK48349.1 Inner membrane protein YhaI [Caballeronia hypogeia]
MSMMSCFGCGKQLHTSAPSCPGCGAPQLSTQVTKNTVTQTSGFGWFVIAIKKYAVFAGRARRKEYWFFTLFYILLAFVVGFVEGLLRLGDGPSTLYSLALLLPSIAVGVRRLHDTGRSGWWLLLPLVNLVFLAQDGQKGSNNYGDDPK